MKKILTLVLTLTISISFAQKANKIVERYIDVIGGKEKLSSVKSILQRGTIDQMGQSVEFELYQNTNGNGYMKMKMMGMDLNIYGIKDGKGYTMNQQMGYDEMSEEDARATAEKNKNIFGNVINNYLNDKEIKYSGKEDVEGKTYEVVELKDNESIVKVYFDPGTSLIAFSKASTDQGEVVIKVEDYMEAAGIKFPKTIVTESGGQEVIKMTISEIIVNPEADQFDEKALSMPE
jgi:hypothetical protein